MELDSWGQIFDFLRCQFFLRHVSGKCSKTPLENLFSSGLEKPVCWKVSGIDLSGWSPSSYPKRKYGVRLAEVRFSTFWGVRFFWDTLARNARKPPWKMYLGVASKNPFAEKWVASTFPGPYCPITRNVNMELDSWGQIFDFLRCQIFLRHVSGKRLKTPLENVFRSGLEKPVCWKVGGVDLFGWSPPGYPKRKYGVR